ncbi:hypothetical protein DEU38_11537 [Rhodococcus sp. AG1013]|nr:hypothetical protein DEU38_11537 [Rhodococcus sp. AG1013]
MNDLARVHPIARIEQGLHLAEAANESLAEHDRQEFAAGLAVTVFAGERAAVADHRAGAVLGEPAVAVHPVGGAEVERDPGVHAPLAEMPIQRSGSVVVPIQEVAEVAEVVAESVGRDRGVLPALVGLGFVRRVRGGAQPGLPRLPHLLLVGGVVEDPGAVGQVPRGVLDEVARLPVRLVLGVAVHLDQQPRVPVR